MACVYLAGLVRLPQAAVGFSQVQGGNLLALGAAVGIPTSSSCTKRRTKSYKHLLLLGTCGYRLGIDILACVTVSDRGNVAMKGETAGVKPLSAYTRALYTHTYKHAYHHGYAEQWPVPITYAGTIFIIYLNTCPYTIAAASFFAEEFVADRSLSLSLRSD